MSKDLILTINSQDRYTAGPSQNFSVMLPNAYFCKGIQLISCEIPLVQFTVNSTNDIIPFTDTSGTYHGTIAYGYYDTTTIAAAIQNAMNASGTTVTYSISYSSTTNQITISPTNVSFSLNFASSPGYNSNYIMGFPPVNISATGTTLTSTSVIDLSLPRVLLIDLGPTVSKKVQTSALTSSSTFIVPISQINQGVSLFTENQYFDEQNQIISLGSQLNVRLKQYVNPSVGEADYNLNYCEWSLQLKLIDVQ